MIHHLKFGFGISLVGQGFSLLCSSSNRFALITYVCTRRLSQILACFGLFFGLLGLSLFQSICAKPGLRFGGLGVVSLGFSTCSRDGESGSPGKSSCHCVRSISLIFFLFEH